MSEVPLHLSYKLAVEKGFLKDPDIRRLSCMMLYLIEDSSVKSKVMTASLY
jgi:hypothetical protein